MFHKIVFSSLKKTKILEAQSKNVFLCLEQICKTYQYSVEASERKMRSLIIMICLYEHKIHVFISLYVFISSFERIKNYKYEFPVMCTRHLIQSTFVMSICGHVSCTMRYVTFNYEVCHERDQSFLIPVPVKEKFVDETTLPISSLNPDWCSPLLPRLRCSFKFKTEPLNIPVNCIDDRRYINVINVHYV